MPTSYQLCCTITFTNTYFPQGTMSGFAVSPTAETQANIINLDLQYRLIQNKLNIFYNQQKMATLNMETLPELTFILQITDQNFYNYTDLSMSQIGGYEFKNRTGSSHLSKQATVTAEDLGASSQTFASIKLTIQLPSQAHSPEQFTLDFQARKTIWRYYIIDQQTASQEPFSIESPDIQGGFTNEGRQTIANIQEAVVFQSNPADPIPLHERSTQQIILKRGGAVLIPYLPYPSPNQILPVEKDGQTHIYSDMYIYV
ncbi:MAG: hypothetical protein AAF587_02490 [Bacteroidota bacterium]